MTASSGLAVCDFCYSTPADPPSCALCGDEIEQPRTAPRRRDWLYCSPRCHRDDGWGAQIVRAVRKGWKPRTKRIALRRNQ